MIGICTPSLVDVEAAAERIAGLVRPLTVVEAGPEYAPGAEVFLGLEFMQHTGSFKARGAANLLAAMLAAGTVPDAGIVSATGRNADIGFAWAARMFGIPATIFLAESAAKARIDRLRALGADVRVFGRTPEQARDNAGLFMARTGAIDAYTHDDNLTSAGAGTILLESLSAIPKLDTIVLAVGAGGMFSGVAAVADGRGIRVVGAEPEGSCALHAALAADAVLDVDIDSIAADSLGAPRISAAALSWARSAEVRSVVVDDDAIIRARRSLWEGYGLVVEHGSATALAALSTGAYRPGRGERVAVILCGANTDPTDLRTSLGAIGNH
ncbi:pyridoxal-phosphate dependent enzyme [Nocardia sp. NPDC051463]|uniref:pyridoxal-phosphate dependent enzyme n=1 Tax=Nocardia sp. NPDC051463 TaxID=3154845 RepID=UPI0034510AE4